MIWGKRDEFVAGSRRRRHAAETGTVKSTARGWHCDYSRYPLVFGAVPALFSLMLFVPSYAAAAENEDVAALRRMLGELKAENRKLSQRLGALEGASATRRVKPAPAHQRPAHAATAAAAAPTVIPHCCAARRSARTARSRFVGSRSEAAAQRACKRAGDRLGGERERDAPDHPRLALEDWTEN